MIFGRQMMKPVKYIVNDNTYNIMYRYITLWLTTLNYSIIRIKLFVFFLSLNVSQDEGCERDSIVYSAIQYTYIAFKAEET